MHVLLLLLQPPQHLPLHHALQRLVHPEHPDELLQHRIFLLLLALRLRESMERPVIAEKISRHLRAPDDSGLRSLPQPIRQQNPFFLICCLSHFEFIILLSIQECHKSEIHIFIAIFFQPSLNPLLPSLPLSDKKSD